ncbi:MAG: hypothetical protein JSS02_08300 [Planctomycetes bacterium]|nr:hypothetical protein [Planctomycetota bacterium]
MTTRRAALCCVSFMLVLGLGTRAFAQEPADSKPATKAPLYWIFLTTGKSTQGTERSEIEKMQAAHLANFGKLYQAGKLFAAGPMSDPQKKKRGIVVATAPDTKALAELFEPDPFIQNGFLTIDAIKMERVVGEFRTDIDANKLIEYRLVLLEKSAVESPEIDGTARKQNLEYCQSIHDAERLCFAGWLTETPHTRRGILIFRKLEDAQLDALLDDLPAVKSKAWKSTKFPLFMSDGVVK